MLGKYAYNFFVLRELLQQLHDRLDLPLPPVFSGLGGLGQPPTSQGIGSNPLFGGLAPPPSTASPSGLSEKERTDIPRILDLLEGVCNEIEIISVAGDIKRAKRDAESYYISREKMQFHIENITERLADELGKASFLHVPIDKEIYYRNASLFSPDIGAKFPKANEDIMNAGTCYALGLNTACVFHLMRVMEHCVQRFGRKLRVTVNVSAESWHQIMLHVHKQVDALPGGAKASKAQNARKQRFAVAASRLDHVRLAWRNDVMHPKATYDAQEALDVLTSVKAFLESIMRLV